MAATGVDSEGKSQHTTVLIGMGAPEGMDRNMWASPTDNVEVLVVSYPMGVDRRCESECDESECEEFEPVTITNQSELEQWARAEFDHYEIRTL